jgi:GntR family transcriptional repressor for pyruvate dehydrogenase complex
MIEKISHASVPDLVFAELSSAILGGRYEPGERLPSQRTLAAELGVNMTTVREALGRLEQLRLIEVRHGEPMRVLDWRQSGGVEALAFVGSFDESVLEPLFEARGLLLQEAAALAARRRTEEQAERLMRLARAIERAPEGSGALLADWQFMSAMVEAAGNLVLSLIMNSVRQVYLPNAEAFTRLMSNRPALAFLYVNTAAAIELGEAAMARESIELLAGLQERNMRGEQ